MFAILVIHILLLIICALIFIFQKKFLCLFNFFIINSHFFNANNIKVDNFAGIWFNYFEWFRDLDIFKIRKCSIFSDWTYCRGDSLHTWDFENNKPKLCLNHLLYEKGK